MVPGEFWDLVPVDASRGRALVRPGLLPIGRIPFREPPCAGTQVGEGIALLLMQFTDYRTRGRADRSRGAIPRVRHSALAGHCRSRHGAVLRECRRQCAAAPERETVVRRSAATSVQAGMVSSSFALYQRI